MEHKVTEPAACHRMETAAAAAAPPPAAAPPAARPPSQSPIKRTRVGPTDLEQILQIGREAMRRTKKGDEDVGKTSSTEDRRFRELFGCGVMVAHAVWAHLEEDGSLDPRSIKDMMRALFFMKSYAKEGTTSIMVGTIDEKTCRNRLWPMVAAIGALESTVVSPRSCW